MIYAWNGFQLLSLNKSLLENVMRVVWDELMTVEETRGLHHLARYQIS